MSRITTSGAQALVAAMLLLVPTAALSPARAEDAKATDIGVDPSALSPTVSHPHLALSTLKRAVFTGKERDPDTGASSKVRMEMTVRDTSVTVAGIAATVVDVAEFSDGQLVERARDFFAQHTSGDVYYVGEESDDYEGGKIVGHEGQWVLGMNGAKAGVGMPAGVKIGDAFESERVPGVAVGRSKVLSTSRTIKVLAGTFKDCVEVEVYDTIDKSTLRRWYCPGVGLVKESSSEKVMELAERVAR